MNAQVGVNRRIFDLGYAHDDINHIQYEGTTKKNYLIQDSIPTPISMFEERISDGTEKYLRPSQIAYELKEANALGKKPSYIQNKLNELEPIGIYEQAISHFPYNINLMQQTQFEIGSTYEKPIEIDIGGQKFKVDRNKIVNSLATTGTLDSSLFQKSEKSEKSV